MNTKEILNLSADKLKRIIALKGEIERLETQLQNVLSGGSSVASPGRVIRKRRPMSAAARKKISLAAKARWAKVRAAAK
jgi:hypothetical protein